jgi:hypothetical protein
MDVLISICVQVIGINTVARSGSPDYLLRTLRALRVSARHDLSSFLRLTASSDCYCGLP